MSQQLSGGLSRNAGTFGQHTISIIDRHDETVLVPAYGHGNPPSAVWPAPDRAGSAATYGDAGQKGSARNIAEVRDHHTITPPLLSRLAR